MSDRELLEMAAKVAGYEIAFDEGDINGFYAHGYDSSGGVVAWWNPLKDDGDALRLAVRLELAIQMICGIVMVTNIKTREEFSDAAFNFEEFQSKVNGAIVRAAAAIGRSMP